MQFENWFVKFEWLFEKQHFGTVYFEAKLAIHVEKVFLPMPVFRGMRKEK